MTLMTGYTSGFKAVKYFAIFFVLVLLLANFSYAASRGDLNSSSYKTLDFKLMKQAHDSWKLKTADSILKLWDYMTSFTKKTDSLGFTTDTFDVNLAKYIKNPGNNQIELKIKSFPQHMVCSLSGKNLNCNVEDGFVGLDSLTMELTDLIWKVKSKLTLNFSLDNEIEETTLPTFKQNSVEKTFPEDSCPIIDLDDYVNNPDAVNYTAEIVKPLANGTSNIVQETKKFNCSPKENFNGTDSTTVKIKESGSELIFNFNITAVSDIPVLDNSKLTNGNVLVSVFDGSSTTLHLLDYVIDPDLEKNYSFTLGAIPNIANCNLSGSDLICTGKTNGEGTFKINLKDGEYILDIPVKVIVSNVNTAPKLNNAKLTNNKIQVNINDGVQTKINLIDYVIDPDSVKNYTYQFVQSPTIANCNVVGNELLCSGKTAGEEDITIKLTDGAYTLDLPTHLSVIFPDKPPVYLGNFTELGVTTFNTVPSFSIALNDYFSDPDTPSLTYGFDKLSGTASLNCSSTPAGLNCTVVGTSSYIDIQFWANDGHTKTIIPKTYRASIVKADDFSAVITGPQKVINEQSFDMTYSVKNNLNFDVYKLPISIQKDTSVKTQFYLDSGSLDGENLQINIKSEENKTNKVSVTTPSFATVQTYNLNPKVDGVYSIYTPITLTSIPYDAAFLKDYFDIISYVPGKNISGHDERMPGFIFGVPYKIYNYLDVPVELNLCKGSYNAGNLFQKVGDIYTSVPNNELCESTKLTPGIFNVILYVQNLNQGIMILDVFIKKNDELVIEKSVDIVLDKKYFTEYVYSYIQSPASGTTLAKNTEYDLSVQFSNGYAYSLVDVPVGIRAAKNEGINTNYTIENELFKINSLDTKIDLKYYLPEKPEDSKVTKSFKFQTKNVIYGNPVVPPYFWVGAGYLLDQNYIQKDSKYYPVN